MNELIEDSDHALSLNLCQFQRFTWMNFNKSFGQQQQQQQQQRKKSNDCSSLATKTTKLSWLQNFKWIEIGYCVIFMHRWTSFLLCEQENVRELLQAQKPLSISDFHVAAVAAHPLYGSRLYSISSFITLSLEYVALIFAVPSNETAAVKRAH